MSHFDVIQFLKCNENKIREICVDIKKKFCLQYFSYGRFYKDNRCIILSTNANVFDNHIKKGYKLCIEPSTETINECKAFKLFTVNNESPAIVIDEYQLFEHGTMIDLFRYNNEFYEMFCFVSNRHDDDIINTYLNNMAVIELFAKDFLEKAGGILKNVEPFLIPYITGNPKEEKENRTIETTHHNIYILGEGYALSKRQFECLSFMSKGYTYKKMAQAMGISFRTVEEYISTIKEKTGCKDRMQLIEAYFNGLKEKIKNPAQ